jgi:hypothetical protein
MLVQSDYIMGGHYNSNTLINNNGNSGVIGVRPKYSNTTSAYYYYYGVGP